MLGVVLSELREQQRRASVARARRNALIVRTGVGALVLAAALGAAVAVLASRGHSKRHSSVVLKPCAVRLVAALCGRLSVPEDPGHPDGRRISLRIAVLPAAHQPSDGALFYLEGGPGGAASDELPEFDQLFGKIAATRDIVFVDQRGTGGSHPLRCPQAAVRVEDVDAVAAYVRRCFARIGREARQYTTAPAMDDIEAVRRALGYGRIDLFGGSYGATAAQIFLRLHPKSVRSLVLDGASLLAVPVYERSAPNAEHGLDAELARCAAAPLCRRTFPHTRAELATLLGRGPRQTTAYGNKVELDADAVATTVHALSLDPDGAALIPEAVHRAAGGDYTSLARAYVDRVGPDLDARTELAMSLEIQCSEPWARYDPGSVKRSGAGSYFTQVSLARAELFARACRYVPRGVVPAGSERLVRSEVPVLLLAGADDPQDPPSNLRGWRSVFPNGRLLVVADGAHGVIADGCVPLVVAQFVAEGSARGLDPTCVGRFKPPPFALSSP
jgi:pimeloyl-ACP methyl ester carboxylesterase